MFSPARPVINILVLIPWMCDNIFAPLYVFHLVRPAGEALEEQRDAPCAHFLENVGLQERLMLGDHYDVHQTDG